MNRDGREKNRSWPILKYYQIYA